MLDWAVSDDPLQGVGIMASLSKHTFYLQDSSQEYLLKLVENLFTRLQSRFGKFVEEQIRAIEDTKVKIKKRKGVISFMKTFPLFSAAVENCFAAVAGRDYDAPHDCVVPVRRLVDDAYERINRAMFDSLKAIAKQNPGGGGLTAPSAGPAPHASSSMASSAMQQVRNVAALPGNVVGVGGGDHPDEDKEMLNYDVLLIENMNHYVEEVDEGAREGVLAHWKARALMERAEALDGYVARVVRRPLGKILVSFAVFSPLSSPPFLLPPFFFFPFFSPPISCIVRSQRSLTPPFFSWRRNSSNPSNPSPCSTPPAARPQTKPSPPARATTAKPCGTS
jgi:hypothetical protein